VVVHVDAGFRWLRLCTNGGRADYACRGTECSDASSQKGAAVEREAA
jgi:hypothetical protein